MHPPRQRLRAAGRGEFAVGDFGAAGHDKADDTAAFQQAIDAVAVKGGIVQVPPGRYKVAGHLKVARGVAVRGANQPPLDVASPLATVILATGGRDIEDAPHRSASATEVRSSP